MIRRFVLPALLMVLALSAPVGAQSPSASPGVPSGALPSPTLTAVGGPDPARADVCRSLDILPERCYLAGSVRITIRGGVRTSVTWPLVKGVGASSDDVPSIALWYGPTDDPRLAIDLPGVPGESTTPKDGDSAGRGEAQVWWSIPDSIVGYGHACRVRYDAEPLGRLTGTIRCPRERAGRDQPYRVDVTFDAEPLLPGPLPTPEPTPAPSPPSIADMACSLLDPGDVEAVLGLKPHSVLMLDAGPGQCVGFAGDQEVAFVAVDESASAADLLPEGDYRGATCEPLALGALGNATGAGSCTWSDGRRFVVGSVLQGPTLLVVSLASDDLGSDEALSQVSALLVVALDRLP
jgi:hypothetical protein